MWLLNTITRKLEQFHGENAPKYAILSHRWEEEELSFDDIFVAPWMKEPEITNRADVIRKLKGYQKLEMCCQRALSYGSVSTDEGVNSVTPIEYVWIDTCCIDKRSSAELSEAINSMYRWYAGAEVCYAYLSDVDGVLDLGKSAWFTRGWTLQELLAPKDVLFLNKDWHVLGTRNGPHTDILMQGVWGFEQPSLAEEIHKNTGIPIAALRDFEPTTYSIAERMSWAANRKTTRVEDEAYCLLGLFNIHMPMLYGEGQAAFTRLQDEIIKITSDLSIFTWNGMSSQTFGMLARSPVEFAASKVQLRPIPPCLLPEGYSVNNSGVSIKLILQPFTLGHFIAYLVDSTSFIAGLGMEYWHFFAFDAIYLSYLPETGLYTRVAINGSCREHMLPLITPDYVEAVRVDVQRYLTILERTIRISRAPSIERHIRHTRLLVLVPATIQPGFFIAPFQMSSSYLSPYNWSPTDGSEAGNGVTSLELKLPKNTFPGFHCCIYWQEKSSRLHREVYVGFDAECRPICLRRRYKTSHLIHNRLQVDIGSGSWLRYSFREEIVPAEDGDTVRGNMISIHRSSRFNATDQRSVTDYVKLHTERKLIETGKHLAFVNFGECSDFYLVFGNDIFK